MRVVDFAMPTIALDEITFNTLLEMPGSGMAVVGIIPSSTPFNTLLEMLLSLHRPPSIQDRKYLSILY